MSRPRSSVVLDDDGTEMLRLERPDDCPPLVWERAKTAALAWLEAGCPEWREEEGIVPR